MTATQTRLRRGTASQCDAMTPAADEAISDTTNNRLRIGDGLRQGGFAIPNFSDVQRQAFGYGTAGGTADALTLTLSPPLLAYTGGVSVEFRASANNTGAATLDVNGLGAVNILKQVGGALVALEADDLVNGLIYKVTHDGTQFQLQYYTPTVQPSGLVFLGTSSFSSLAFISLINSDFDSYLIDFSLDVSGSSNLAIQFSTNNGSSYITTGYNNGGTTNQSQINISPQGSFYYGKIDLRGVNTSSGLNRKMVRSEYVGLGLSLQIATGQSYGALETSVAAVNAVRILNASAGSATLYGYSK